jgi:hypothetical protein
MGTLTFTRTAHLVDACAPKPAGQWYTVSLVRGERDRTTGVLHDIETEPVACFKHLQEAQHYARALVRRSVDCALVRIT